MAHKSVFFEGRGDMKGGVYSTEPKDPRTFECSSRSLSKSQQSEKWVA